MDSMEGGLGQEHCQFQKELSVDRKGDQDPRKNWHRAVQRPDETGP